jgi:hypothetical protein
VKFGEEVKAENFSSRIVWAAGYFAEPTYYVREGKIDGAKSLGRAAAFIKNGQFRDARFEIRDSTAAKLVPGSKWSLESFELRGSRELAGLKVLFLLLSNWDIKPENMAIMEANGQPFYAVTDWGASMGRAADITGRSKWDCVSYARDSDYFVEGVENGFVIFNYQGKQSEEVPREIRPEHVQWLMQRLGRLSDQQVDAALKASGATADEAACFAKGFRSRLGHLIAIGQGSPEGVVTKSRREIKIIRKQPPQQ